MAYARDPLPQRREPMLPFPHALVGRETVFHEQQLSTCLMTTWHAKESLADPVDFFLSSTIPDEERAPQPEEWPECEGNPAPLPDRPLT